MSAQAQPERGETLIELIISIAILGILFAAVLGAVFTSQLTNDANQRSVSLAVGLRNYAEKAKSVPASTSGCSAGDYTGLLTAPGVSFSVAKVEYWNGSAFTSSCSDVQKVTLVASDTGQRIAPQRLDVVRRRA